MDENKKPRRNPCSLSTSCIEKLAKFGPYCEGLDDQEIMNHLSNPEQKFTYLKSIFTYRGGRNSKWFWMFGERDGARPGGKQHRIFSLLTNNWILMTELLKLRGERRLQLHTMFQTIINTEKLFIHQVMVNNLIQSLQSPNNQFSVKAIYEMLLFATFLQDAGWFAESERLLLEMLDKIGSVFIEDDQDGIQVQYFGPHTENLPLSLKQKKNVYSALLEIKINLLKCIIAQPSAENFQRAEDMISTMDFNDHLLSYLKTEDRLALKVVFHTLCCWHHNFQNEYNSALKSGLQGLQFLILYGYHREDVHATHNESVNGVRIQPAITVDCLRHTARALMGTGDHINGEKLMEVAINMHKREMVINMQNINYAFAANVKKPICDINYALLLQDYGEILRLRQKAQKSYDCFVLAVQILTKLFGCQSAFNLHLAQARSRLAGAYRFQALIDDEEHSYMFWARRAKNTSIAAFNVAQRIIASDPKYRPKSSLILTHMRRMLAWADEDIIIKTWENPLSISYANRLQNMLQRYDELLSIYQQSFKPGNLCIAEVMEDKARIITHLIQRDKAREDYEQMKTNYDLVFDLCVKSIKMKIAFFEKEGLLGEKHFTINYRQLGEYYVQRFVDLKDVCELELAEDALKRSISISSEWLGEYHCRLGVAYSCLARIYEVCGLMEEAQAMHDKWLHWQILQEEMIESERSASHKECLMCRDFSCIDCYSCICQTKLVVTKIDQYENFFDIMQQVFYECGSNLCHLLEYVIV